MNQEEVEENIDDNNNNSNNETKKVPCDSKVFITNCSLSITNDLLRKFCKTSFKNYEEHRKKVALLSIKREEQESNRKFLLINRRYINKKHVSKYTPEKGRMK